MNRKLKTDAIPSGLLRHLRSAGEYINEGMEISKKMITLMDKKTEELTDEEKAIFIRSSELVLLIETTMKIERIK